VIPIVIFILGVGIILWAAERLTDGVLAAAASFAVSAFFIGALVSGFEPENLVTGIVANFQGLSQVALGTVVGAAIFMLLGGFGAALLIVPMKVEIPLLGVFAMVLSLLPFGWALLNDGRVSRWEGLLLCMACVALVVWLYRISPMLLTARSQGEMEGAIAKPQSRARSILLVGFGTVGLVIGAEMVVYGATGIIQRFGVSETFFGMTIVAIGESLEETARMVAPARRGQHDVALGNVVGTTVIFLTLNLGLIALIRPISADPWVLKFHVPYLIGSVLFVGVLLMAAKRLGRLAGTALILLYILYLGLNVKHF
jgi:cation:H+ antiporter